jgi:hypothetical protein
MMHGQQNIKKSCLDTAMRKNHVNSVLYFQKQTMAK